MANPKVVQVSPSGRSSGKTTTYLKFIGTYSHPLGKKLAKYQVRVYRVSDQTEFWNSGVVTASAAEIRKKRFEIGYNVDTGGTALVYDTQYMWKCRVWDEDDNRSIFTQLLKFTPLDLPQVPSNLAPTEGKLISAQSGGDPSVTFSGDFAHPEGAALTAFQYQIRKKGERDLTYDSGNVTDSGADFSQAYGTANSNDTPATPPDLRWNTEYQWRARVKDDSADTTTEWSRWSDWILFRTASPPKRPTLTGPIDGAVILTTKPVLGWEYIEGRYRSGHQTSAVVEAYLEDDNSAVYDTPATLSSEATTYSDTSALTTGKRYKWRVKTQGYAGPGYSQWSEWGAFFVATTLSASITSPTQGATVTTPSFDVTFTYNGQYSLYSYEIRMFTDLALTTQIYTTGALSAERVIGNAVFAGNSVTHTLDEEDTHVLDGTTYYLRITLTDEHGQSGVSPIRQVIINYTPPATISSFTATANV